MTSGINRRKGGKNPHKEKWRRSERAHFRVVAAEYGITVAEVIEDARARRHWANQGWGGSATVPGWGAPATPAIVAGWTAAGWNVAANGNGDAGSTGAGDGNGGWGDNPGWGPS
ncbi:hypothetical protein C8R47DRAFT_1218548 [Mycena vitilis]|nr:hypothetical protein C8R47DRAFT_1218548 [Mycena vitilis]